MVGVESDLSWPAPPEKVMVPADVLAELALPSTMPIPGVRGGVQSVSCEDAGAEWGVLGDPWQGKSLTWGD